MWDLPRRRRLSRSGTQVEYRRTKVFLKAPVFAAEILVSGKPRLLGSPLGREEPCARMSSTQPSIAAGDVSALGESVLSRADSKPRRLTIAVLLDYLNFFGGGYEAQLRDALHAKCREEGHELLLLYGGALDGPRPMGAGDNAIFKILQPNVVDGIVVVSPLLAAYCGPEGVGRLVERYRPTPLCSVGIALPGVPSIVLDNQPGMEAAVEHLIRDHDCRRLAFLAGTPKNPEAEIRFKAYRDVLERNGIVFDPALVASGLFRTNTGQVAMDEILARGVAIDGVVAANDEMAIGAIEALRKSGRRVPQDIPITGFDDLVLARLGNPPLTTVAQPFDLVAGLAIRSITDQVAGRAVSECAHVSARFIRRHSCGCGHEFLRRGTDILAAAPMGLAEDFHARGEVLMAALASTLRVGSIDGTRAAGRMLDGLRAEVAGQADAFQNAISDLLEDIGDDNERHRMLQNAITCLRDGLRGTSDVRVERCFYDGLALVAFSNTTTQVQHRLRLDENYLRLLTVGEQASAAFDLSSLKDALVKGLPTAGVRTVFLSCAPDDSDTELQPVVCLLGGVAHEPSVARFPASRLIPPGVIPAEQRETLLVFPLAFESHLLGVVAFDYSEGTNGYVAFRNEIAAALRSLRLHQELVQKTMLHERSVQERLATAKRMEALSVLAGGVAHDLNNALGPLVALPDVILEELGELKVGEDAVQELRADVESIKTASLRAAQTIKDLLTLGRQGRTAKERLDLNRVVESCLPETSPRRTKERNLHIKMVLRLAPEPLIVQGAESQLARAIGNLVHNGTEAIEGDGEVVVKTSSVHMATARVGYETIPPGHYVKLTVSDDGCGISPQDLARAFEPFFTRKRAGESSGSGLGLAIVHGVVKEHGGFIDVTSTLGAGTTFAIYLPQVQETVAREQELAVAPRGHARILVVDDEPVQLRTCRRSLIRLGYQVETLDSGCRARELFGRAALSGESPFDLVIIDMILNEELDGLHVFEQIQLLFPAQKAIVVSGHAPTERAELAVKKGLTWLAKPYNMEELAHAVQRVLRDDATAARW